MQHIPPVLLELRNVDVVFDGIIQVLRSVNLEVRAGKVTALLGGNGAGKTTTLKAISGLLAVEHGKVTDGQIRFEGEDISNADPVKLFRRGVVQVLEGRKVLAHLSVEQNLLVGGHHRADRQAVQDDIERVYGYFPRLRGLDKTRVRLLVRRRNADAPGRPRAGGAAEASDARRAVGRLGAEHRRRAVRDRSRPSTASRA